MVNTHEENDDRGAREVAGVNTEADLAASKVADGTVDVAPRELDEGAGSEQAEALSGDQASSAESASETTAESASEIASDSADTSAVTEEVTDTGSPQDQKMTVQADGLPLVLPLGGMSPEERFRATTRLIFLAPDVPPVQPRPRRSDMRRLDDIFDQRAHTGGHDREWGHDRGGERHEHREVQSTRTRRRNSNTSQSEQQEDEEPRRAQRQAPVVTEPQKVKGSTRLEAKKQRRRDGRDAGRRRTVITESEFLARRESVDREMIVRTTADRIQIGVLEDKVLVEHYVARSSESSIIGNVYLGRVQNVLPSMEAAFVDIGRGRNAVLYSGEVDWSEFEGGNTARKIENALKPGDSVLVQVTKDPVGHKGARLTSQISLPGRFLVYVPGGAMNGISRKLPDTERARLKKILKEVLPSGAGVIVRTAAEGATEDQLTDDVQRLTRQWESIQARAQKGGGPAMLHSEPDMLIKIVRDVFNEDFHRMVIEGAETFEVIESYLTNVAPDLMQRVERYHGERDIFDEYRLSEQIVKALDRKVWLPSGGSLVIDRTEAMTVVDVNTGKFVGAGGNLEETVTKNNLEAAEEIVRQLRLRDIGGIIVIDFIDMVLESNRDLVLRRLVECLGRDRTKHQVAEVTSLGLVQMTRKKLGLGLLESFSEPCDVCAGRGVVIQHEPVHKHRAESNGRSKRSGNRPQQEQPKAQTHAITDGAKNMLAQVAASTIASEKGAPKSGEKGGQERPASAAQHSSAGEKAADVKASGVKTANVQAPDVQASAVSVLDSVLQALPEAPPAGASKSRSRRVTQRASAPAGAVVRKATDPVEVAARPASVVQPDEQALDPEQALLQALDAQTQARGK